MLFRSHVELDGQFLSLDVLDTAGKVRISSFNRRRVVLSVWATELIIACR